MDVAGVVTTAVTSLITASVTGGIAALLMLPRQKRQLDATIEQTRVATANSLIDQLQEEVDRLRAQLRQLSAEAAEEREHLRERIDQLKQDVAERDARIRQLQAS